MTITPHGYPDYSKLLARTDELFVNDQAASVAGTKVYPAFFCGNTEALRVALDGASGTGELQVFFYMDQARTQQVAFMRFGIGPAQDLHKTFVPPGPYFVSQMVTGPTSPVVYNLVISSTTPGAWSNEQYRRVILKNQIVVAIGAGATATFDLDNSFIGEAFFSANVNQATSWGCSIQSNDNSGVSRYIMRLGVFTGAFTTRLWLPGGYLHGEIFNLDVTARNYDWVLIGNPSDT